MSEVKPIKDWHDLDATTQKNALENDSFFANLRIVYPKADFSERDRLLERYKIDLTCKYCGNVVKANFLTGIPTVCSECKRQTLDAPTTAGAVANWLLDHYKFATTENKDQNLFVYDEATGTWSDNIADAVLKHECSVIFGENITTTKVNNVRLALQAKTYIEPNVFSTAIRKVDKKLLINVANGVVEQDLETFEVKLLEKSPSFYFLAQIPVKFDENADAPEKFIEFLANITLPNEENFVNLLEGFGYPLLAGYPIQRVLALVGSGQNGKSTYFAAMEKFYGEKYISHLTMQQLSNATENSPFALVQLQGKLANIADDLPNKAVRDVGYFKQLTGGSSVEAERKFGNRFSFVNSAKFYFSANRMPEVSEDTAAFYRRFLFIEFTNVIATPRDQKEVINEIVDEKEKSGLLNLMLGLVLPKLLKQNDFTCAKSIDVVAEQYQRHSNSAKLFFDKRIEYDYEGSIRKEDIWGAYEQFCTTEGLVLVSTKAFWIAFKEEFSQAVEQQYQEQGIHKRNFKGIKFKDLENENEEPEIKINLDEYFKIDQHNQQNQVSGIFYAVKKTRSKYNIIKENTGFIGNAGFKPDNSNNILEKQPKNEQKEQNDTEIVPFPTQTDPKPINPELIHGRIETFLNQIPKEGIIVGTKPYDFSLLLSLPQFADLPSDLVEREFNTMLNFGDLRVVPNNEGLFAIVPIHHNKPDDAGDDIYTEI